jgi:hypothetical protein
MKTPCLRPSGPEILCELHAPSARRSSGLVKIIAALGHDVGQLLRIKVLELRGGKAEQGASLTLHLPAELAASQHQVWCLACRLACFCPAVRVGVFVVGTEFNSRSRARRGERRAG